MINEEIPSPSKNTDKWLLDNPVELHAWLANFLDKFDAIASQLNLPEEEVSEIKTAVNLQMRLTLEQIEANDRKCAAEFLLAQKDRELSEALNKMVLTQKHGRD